MTNPDTAEKARAYYAGPQDELGYKLSSEFLALPSGIRLARLTWGYPGEWRVAVCRDEPRIAPNGASLYGINGCGSAPSLEAACALAYEALLEEEAAFIERMEEHARKRADAEANAAYAASEVDAALRELLGSP